MDPLIEMAKRYASLRRNGTNPKTAIAVAIDSVRSDAMARIGSTTANSNAA
jgi:hypothetical protein